MNEVWTAGALACAVAILVTAVMLFARRAAERRADDPQVVLRRCKLELHLVRRELSRIPATSDAHDVFAQLLQTEQEIDWTSKVLRRKVNQ